MPVIRTNSFTSMDSNRTEKRVSFRDIADPKSYNTQHVESKDHTIRIEELYPERTYRPILRGNLPDLNHIRHASTKSKPKRKHVIKTEPAIQHKPHRLPPFKKPTEPLSHALLRTMSYNKPNSRSYLPPIDIIVQAKPEISVTELVASARVTRRGWKSPRSQASYISKDASSKSQYSTSDTTTCNSKVSDIVVKCGACLKQKRTSSACGFCRYCDEYLCANCVYKHRGLLTRSHPVMVFNCDACKEMNVLNKKDSGFCVRCMKYFCPKCLIPHCSVTNHDVLEGHDLLDIVYATIHRDFKGF